MRDFPRVFLSLHSPTAKKFLLKDSLRSYMYFARFQPIRGFHSNSMQVLSRIYFSPSLSRYPHSHTHTREERWNERLSTIKRVSRKHNTNSPEKNYSSFPNILFPRWLRGERMLRKFSPLLRRGWGVNRKSPGVVKILGEGEELEYYRLRTPSAKKKKKKTERANSSSARVYIYVHVHIYIHTYIHAWRVVENCRRVAGYRIILESR